jgi:hypothetical protein
MVENGVNGYVLEDPRDAGALADCVDRLRDPVLRGRLGGKASRVTDRIGMARHANEIMSIYEEIGVSTGPRR